MRTKTATLAAAVGAMALAAASVVGLGAASAVAATLPPLPSLPSARTMPAVAPPSLGPPGTLNPQIASWAKTFSAQAQRAIAAASVNLGTGGADASFAKMWAAAEARSKQASGSLAVPALPASSALSASLPALSGSALPAIADMAPPTLAMPATPTPHGGLDAGFTALFGQPPAVSAVSLPPYSSIAINPAYASKTLLGEIGGGCRPSGAGCAYSASPAQMLATLETAANAGASPASMANALVATAAGQAVLAEQTAAQNEMKHYNLMFGSVRSAAGVNTKGYQNALNGFNKASKALAQAEKFHMTGIARTIVDNSPLGAAAKALGF